MANVIEKIQKLTLVISHNKTLAAQLYQEFRDFFPTMPYPILFPHDYYQPEAYIPQTDTYIEKRLKSTKKLINYGLRRLQIYSHDVTVICRCVRILHLQYRVCQRIRKLCIRAQTGDENNARKYFRAFGPAPI